MSDQSRLYKSIDRSIDLVFRFFWRRDRWIGISPRGGRSFSREEEETTTQVRNIRVIRYVAGATCSCVTASGFFPEAERRPADCAAAADGADVVVLLPTAATERGVHCSKAALADFLAGEGIKIGWGSRAGETKRRRVRA